LSENMFAISNARGPLTRATLGMGLALAAIGAIWFGGGVAGAAPQQPLLVDDPVPVPAPAGADPTTAVNIANAIFSELGSLLDVVFPGSGSIFTPVTSGADPLSPGYPSTVLPEQTPAMPGYPNTVLPGQTPAFPGQSPALPGYPGTVLPGQTPAMPGYPNTVLPGQTPGLPGQTPALPGQTSPLAPADTGPIV
jgi:hypothetical protein